MVRLKPIPVQIPLDLAEALDLHPSNLSHVNAGRRRLAVTKAIRLMEISLTDERLAGLAYYHLRPEQKAAHPYVCLCPYMKLGCNFLKKKKGKNNAGKNNAGR